MIRRPARSRAAHRRLSRFAGRGNLRATIATGALLAFAPVLAFAQTPHASGTVHVEVRSGAIRGDVCIAGLPPGDTIRIALNRALELRMVDGSPPGLLDQRLEPGGATRVYTLLRSRGADRPQPAACFQYEGVESVHDVEAQDFRTDDASSVIAFDGRSVRARGASRWLPTPFDSTLGLARERMTFRLRISCPRCPALYMSGSPPTFGPVATFRSTIPREPYLVAGSIAVTRTGDSWALGADSAAAAALRDRIRPIEEFYSSFLGIPFGDEPDLVFLRELRAPRDGRLWGFFSDPALTFVGTDPASLLERLDDSRPRIRNTVLGFLAHELAHRYFGWSLGTRSPHRDFFGEPFATYLELRAIRHLAGETAYRDAVQRLRTQLPDSIGLPPIDSATATTFSFDAYRYAYAPLLLLSLEDVIGEPAMTSLLRDLLRLPPPARASLDFAAFVDLASRSSGHSGPALLEWRRRCLSPRAVGRGCRP